MRNTKHNLSPNNQTGGFLKTNEAPPFLFIVLFLWAGVTIKVCLYDDADRITVRTEEKTLYTEEDFRDFLARRGLIGLRELTGYRSFHTLDDLHTGAVYQGVRLLGD